MKKEQAPEKALAKLKAAFAHQKADDERRNELIQNGQIISLDDGKYTLEFMQSLSDKDYDSLKEHLLSQIESTKRMIKALEIHRGKTK